MWLAVEEESGTEVALKIVPGKAMPGTRAEREASAAARLRHDRCLRAHALARDTGHVYIVYEYVPGRTLREAMREQPRRPGRDRNGRADPRRPGQRACPRHRAPRREAGERPARTRPGRERQALRLRPGGDARGRGTSRPSATFPAPSRTSHRSGCAGSPPGPRQTCGPSACCSGKPSPAATPSGAAPAGHRPPDRGGRPSLATARPDLIRP